MLKIKCKFTRVRKLHLEKAGVFELECNYKAGIIKLLNQYYNGAMIGAFNAVAINSSKPLL